MRMTSERLWPLLVGLLVAIVVIAIPPLLVVALALGVPLGLILGVRHMGRHRHWSGRRRLVLTCLGLILWALWGYSPHLITPSRPEFSPEQARLAARADRDVREHLDSWNEWVMRMDVTQVVQEAEKDRVCVVGYTLFYIPMFRYEVYWDRSSNEAGGGTYRPWPLTCLPRNS